MDGFQIRLELLHLLKFLNASQQSIQKILTFAMQHSSKAEDVWSCIMSQSAITYGPLARRDLKEIFLDLVVPKGNWDAVRLNAGSAQQILSSWRHKRLFDSGLLEEVDSELKDRRKQLRTLPPSESASYGKFSKSEVLRRMEEDRERHKRLREGMWILPPKSFVDSLPLQTSKSIVSSPSSQLRNLVASPKESTSTIGAKDTRPVGVARAASNASKANSKRDSSVTSMIGGESLKKKRKGEEEGILSPESANLTSEMKEERNDDDKLFEEDEKVGGSNFKGLDSLDVEFEEAWETTSDFNEDDLEIIGEEDGKWWGGEDGFKKVLEENSREEEELKKQMGKGIDEENLGGNNGRGIVIEGDQKQSIMMNQQEQQLQLQEQERVRNQEEFQLQAQVQVETRAQIQQNQQISFQQRQQQQSQHPSPQNHMPPTGPGGYYQNNNFRGGRGGGNGYGRPPPSSNRGGFGNQMIPSNDNMSNVNHPPATPSPRGGGIRPMGILNRGAAHFASPAYRGGRGRGGWR